MVNNFSEWCKQPSKTKRKFPLLLVDCQCSANVNRPHNAFNLHQWFMISCEHNVTIINHQLVVKQLISCAPLRLHNIYVALPRSSPATAASWCGCKNWRGAIPSCPWHGGTAQVVREPAMSREHLESGDQNDKMLDYDALKNMLYNILTRVHYINSEVHNICKCDEL